MRVACVLILGLVGLALADTAAAQELYRWQDKDGKYHFSQTAPNDQDKVHDVINRHGQVIEHVDVEGEKAARTRARAEKIQQQLAQRKAEEIDKVRQRLKRAYANHRDIERTRDTQLKAIDTNIATLLATIDLQRAQMRALVRQAGNAERGGNAPPKQSMTQINRVRGQIHENMAFVVKKRKDRLALQVHYADEEARYDALVPPKS